MKKKIVSLVLVFALALALGIGGTLAWLTATSDEVVNTFTVGNITLTIAEPDAVDTDEDGDYDFKILPGSTVAKNPQLTVDVGSEKCYVYACITNTVKVRDTVVVSPIIATSGDEGYWIQVGDTADDKTLYRWSEEVDASAAAVTLDVFTQVKYAESIEMTDSFEGMNITVQGFAHQSVNTDTTTADAAATGHFWPSEDNGAES